MEVAEQLGKGVNILSVEHRDKLTREASFGLELAVKKEQVIAGLVHTFLFTACLITPDTLCKKDAISVIKKYFIALERVTDEVHENDKHVNGHVIAKLSSSWLVQCQLN